MLAAVIGFFVGVGVCGMALVVYMAKLFSDGDNPQ